MSQLPQPAVVSSQQERTYCWVLCGNAKKVTQSLQPLAHYILQAQTLSAAAGDKLPPISLFRLETVTTDVARTSPEEDKVFAEDRHNASVVEGVQLRWLTAESAGATAEPPNLSDIDLLLLKLGDASLQVRNAVLQWTEDVQVARKSAARPPLVIVDPVEAVDRVSSRSELLQRLQRSAALRRLGVGVPATVEYDIQSQMVLSVVGSDSTSAGPTCVDKGALVIVKPDLSNGPASTHAMVVFPRSTVLHSPCCCAIVPREGVDTAVGSRGAFDVTVDGHVLLRHAAQLGGHSRVVVQELLLDAEVVHKVYIIGDTTPHVVKLRNDTLLRQAMHKAETDGATGFAFHSQEKSLFPPACPPPSDAPQPQQQQDSGTSATASLSLDHSLLVSLAAVLRAELGLTLLGVDVVASRIRPSSLSNRVEGEDDELRWNLIDVNYFPSFSCVPDAHRRLVHHLLDLCRRTGVTEMCD